MRKFYVKKSIETDFKYQNLICEMNFDIYTPYFVYFQGHPEMSTSEIIFCHWIKGVFMYGS
jgi:hypothetical protein